MNKELKEIKNEKDYDKALKRVDELMKLNPSPITPQSNELDFLVLLIKKYEEEKWSIQEPPSIK